MAVECLEFQKNKVKIVALFRLPSCPMNSGPLTSDPDETEFTLVGIFKVFFSIFALFKGTIRVSVEATQIKCCSVSCKRNS